MSTIECLKRKMNNDPLFNQLPMFKQLKTPESQAFEQSNSFQYIKTLEQLKTFEQLDTNDFRSNLTKKTNQLPLKPKNTDKCIQCFIGIVVSYTYPCLHAVLCQSCLKKNATKKKCVVCDRKCRFKFFYSFKSNV